jgi:hypothetical protein
VAQAFTSSQSLNIAVAGQKATLGSNGSGLLIGGINAALQFPATNDAPKRRLVMAGTALASYS